MNFTFRRPNVKLTLMVELPFWIQRIEQACELILRQSGKLLEITSLAKHCGLSRPTITSYLDVLEATHLLHLLRPYHGGGRREIIAQPKAYGFDTGFVSHFRSWESFHPDHGGLLLEHLVFDLLRAHFPQQTIHFWRDKQQREIDFVLPEKNGAATVIECKWSHDSLNTRNLDAFAACIPRVETSSSPARRAITSTERSKTIPSPSAALPI